MELIFSNADPYAEKIKEFVFTQFSANCCKEKDVQLDLITKEILGTGQTRYGPMPNPESVVEIRRVISFWMERQKPIPFLIPWGSEKPNGSGIDVAELCSFKMLECLNNRVKQFYEPGLVMNIKMEDVSAPHLFYDRMEQARKDVKLYTTGFITLLEILRLEFINIVLESHIVDEKTYNDKADEYLPYMEMYLRGHESYLENLTSLGWKGPIEQETKDFTSSSTLRCILTKDRMSTSTSWHATLQVVWFVVGLGCTDNPCHGSTCFSN
jgi:hypothetical protein